MAKTKISTPATMSELVEQMGDKLIPFNQGDVVDVRVINTARTHAIVDVAGLATGIIPEKEFSTTKLAVGSTVRAYVMSTQNEKGYVILSMRRAEKEKLWKMLEQRNLDGEVITVKVIQANKGGLVAEYGDMQGFIPVSQLSYKHYPRVDGDRSKIQQKLSELIGSIIQVKIISYDKISNKIIFSEKAAQDAELVEKASSYEVGQKVEGKVSGIVDFGLFVNLGDIEGLVHISQVSYSRINNLKELYKVGDKITAEIVSVDGGRVSLSIKKLLPDPWQTEAKGMMSGDVVKGEVTKVTPYGAFVRLTENLEGLCNFQTNQDEPQTALEEGKTYSFEITSIEPELKKIALVLKK